MPGKRTHSPLRRRNQKLPPELRQKLNKQAWRLVTAQDWPSPGEQMVAWERERKRLYAEALATTPENQPPQPPDQL